MSNINQIAGCPEPKKHDDKNDLTEEQSIDILEYFGYSFKAGMIIKPKEFNNGWDGHKYKYLSKLNRVNEAINYLYDEWDYGYEEEENE